MSEKILAQTYRLVEQIGMGGMAIVYRAVNVRTGQSVAVKVLRPEFAQDAEYVSRFQREAEAASQMTHHNIVNLVDVGMDGDSRYLVMEYVQGKTLKQVIQEKGRISPATAAQITIRILSALQHAHQNGIIHRDIKPQNILVNEEGHIKVADFGIARIANSATLTTGNNVLGSVHYYSPEQASGQAADERSDIYSVGVVLYEMLTGRMPFDGDTLVSIAMQHMYSPPPPVERFAPEVPAAISHVCMMAMEKNPNYRYQSAKEMAAELRMALEGRDDEMQPRLVEQTEMPTVAAPAAPAPARPAPESVTAKPPKPKKPRKRINVLWWIVTLLVAAAAFYGIYVGSVAIYDQVVNSVDVPDFVGMEISAAERTAGRAGLNVEIFDSNHPTIPEGQVILQAPISSLESGKKLKRGDTVVLHVSTGPSSQKVPRLVDLSLNDAIAVAQSSGLTITVVDRVTSIDVQAGFVISQTPEVGEPCQSGDIIQVTVSGGLAVAPSVLGKTLPEAQEILVAAGLAVNPNVNFELTDSDALHDTVAAQSLPEGTQVIQETVVTLTVYQKPSLTHSVEVTLDLPESEGILPVRVTLNDGEHEYTVYQNDFRADETRRPTVTLISQLPGEFSYCVYLNNSSTATYRLPVTIP